MNLSQRRKIQRDFTFIASAGSSRRDSRRTRQAASLVAWIGLRKGERVLDAACGTGTLARALAQAGARAAAIDLTPQMARLAKQARSKSKHDPIFAVGNVEDLPYRNGTFSLTTCAYSSANFPDPLRALRELARVTKRRGRIVLEDVFAPEDPERCLYLNRVESLRGNMPTRILKYSEFLALFRKAGLRLAACRLHQSSQSLRQWLQGSPAASRPSRARLLRRLILASADRDLAGLRPERSGRDLVLHYSTAWFMLRRG